MPTKCHDLQTRNNRFNAAKVKSSSPINNCHNSIVSQLLFKDDWHHNVHLFFRMPTKITREKCIVGNYKLSNLSKKDVKLAETSDSS